MDGACSSVRRCGDFRSRPSRLSCVLGMQRAGASRTDSNSAELSPKIQAQITSSGALDDWQTLRELQQLRFSMCPWFATWSSS